MTTIFDAYFGSSPTPSPKGMNDRIRDLYSRLTQEAISLREQTVQRIRWGGFTQWARLKDTTIRAKQKKGLPSPQSPLYALGNLLQRIVATGIKIVGFSRDDTTSTVGISFETDEETKDKKGGNAKPVNRGSTPNDKSKDPAIMDDMVRGNSKQNIPSRSIQPGDAAQARLKQTVDSWLRDQETQDALEAQHNRYAFPLD